MSPSNVSQRYILITPARNEEAYLERTILSVTGQTVLPERWVIVSDGSTDRTDEIIRDHAARFAWIRYVRRPEHADRQFAAKALAFREAYAVEGRIVGNLDADLSFGPDVLEFLLAASPGPGPRRRRNPVRSDGRGM
jgi:glycosyltransferase involved in cell wall biosynthesis